MAKTKVVSKNDNRRHSLYVNIITFNLHILYLAMHILLFYSENPTY